MPHNPSPGWHRSSLEAGIKSGERTAAVEINPDVSDNGFMALIIVKKRTCTTIREQMRGYLFFVCAHELPVFPVL